MSLDLENDQEIWSSNLLWNRTDLQILSQNSVGIESKKLYLFGAVRGKGCLCLSLSPVPRPQPLAKNSDLGWPHVATVSAFVMVEKVSNK